MDAPQRTILRSSGFPVPALPSALPPWCAGRTLAEGRDRPTRATQAAERLAGDQRLPAEVAVMQTVKGQCGHLSVWCHGVPPLTLAGLCPFRLSPSSRQNRATPPSLPDGARMSSRTVRLGGVRCRRAPDATPDRGACRTPAGPIRQGLPPASERAGNHGRHPAREVVAATGGDAETSSGAVRIVVDAVTEQRSFV